MLLLGVKVTTQQQRALPPAPSIRATRRRIDKHQWPGCLRSTVRAMQCKHQHERMQPGWTTKRLGPALTDGVARTPLLHATLSRCISVCTVASGSPMRFCSTCRSSAAMPRFSSSTSLTAARQPTRCEGQTEWNTVAV